MKDAMVRWPWLFTVEALLVLLVLVAGGVTVYQRSRVADVQQQRNSATARLSEIEKRLAAVNNPQDLEAVQEEIRQLQAKQEDLDLPTRREAIDVSTALSDYAARANMRVLSLRSGAGPTLTGQDSLPTVDISLEVQGSMTNLIGLLGEVDRFTASRVEYLSFTRSGGQERPWALKLTVRVPYRDGADGAG